MMIRQTLILFLFLLFVARGSAQTYPQNYFSPPLDPPLIVVGTFGEIRQDHFHSGIDLSTQEMEGLPVMAAADGYVSRIKIDAEGFGKAIYITHPNGFVTVYGHLQKFTAPINEYVKKSQYEKQTFEIELYPKSKEYKVKKGEVIGYSGNTGSTSGPHLHFEIRDQETEEPINPLLFGLPLADTTKPVLQWVRVFPVREAGVVNKSDSAVTYEIMQTDGINYLNTTDYIQAVGLIGFGFGVTDHQEGSTSELGIYSAELYVDAQLAYVWHMDRFNFNDTRYVNAHIDYVSKERDGRIIERCFRLPGNHLNIYPDTTITGYQNFTEDIAHDIKFVAKDFKGNATQLEFQVVTYSSMNNVPYQAKPEGAMLVTNKNGSSFLR